MPDVSPLGHRLWRFRKRAKLTQQQLADLAGVHRNVISHAERGFRHHILAENLAKLARALHVSMDELYGYDQLEEAEVEKDIVAATA